MIKETLENFGIKGEEGTICEFLSHNKDLLIQAWNDFLERKKIEDRTDLQKQIETEIEIPEIIEIDMATIPENNVNKDKQIREAFGFEIKEMTIILKNGKVGQDYFNHFSFDDLNLSRGDISFEFHNLEEVGLHYDSEKKAIVGKPNKAGDFKIKIRCKDSELGEFEKNITLIVNPDPRSLWNDLPTSENIEYYKPDKEFLQIIQERTMLAGSIRGRSHAHEGKPRDDDFGLAFVEETDWYLLCVADGAGSVPYSRKGSSIACRQVTEYCKELLKNDQDLLQVIEIYSNDPTEATKKLVGDAIYHLLGGAAFAAYKAIDMEAKENGRAIRDYATTLIISIVKKIHQEWFIASFWIGDGGIGIYNKETPSVKIQGEPDGGDYAGQTRFLTMGDTMQATELYRRLRFDLVPDFTALVLMTDGVSDPIFETDANLQNVERWNLLWKEFSTAVNFDNKNGIEEKVYDWLSFWSPGNHDDRTIAILF